MKYTYTVCLYYITRTHTQTQNLELICRPDSRSKYPRFGLAAVCGSFVICTDIRLRLLTYTYLFTTTLYTTNTYDPMQRKEEKKEWMNELGLGTAIAAVTGLFILRMEDGEERF